MRIYCIRVIGIIWIPYAVYYFWSGFGIANGCVGSVRFVGVVVALKRIDSLFTHSIIAFILSFWIVCGYRMRWIIGFELLSSLILTFGYALRNGVLHTVHIYSSHIGRYHQILSFSCQATTYLMNDMTNYLMVYDRSEELLVSSSLKNLLRKEAAHSQLPPIISSLPFFFLSSDADDEMTT